VQDVEPAVHLDDGGSAYCEGVAHESRGAPVLGPVVVEVGVRDRRSGRRVRTNCAAGDNQAVLPDQEPGKSEPFRLYPRLENVIRPGYQRHVPSLCFAGRTESLSASTCTNKTEAENIGPQASRGGRPVP